MDVAQNGFFLKWVFHRPGPKYGPVALKIPRRKSPHQGVGDAGAGAEARAKGRSRGPARLREVDKVEEVTEVVTDESRVIALNSTQSVVVVLLHLLPTATYRVFMDNPFSSSDLFLSLRQHGPEATGTARANSSIWRTSPALKSG
jgi:hypothetical protein